MCELLSGIKFFRPTKIVVERLDHDLLACDLVLVTNQVGSSLEFLGNNV
jgi:hypothetical protein